jgi:lipopolysaccharide biosynthesis glycosyltransferase
MRYKEEDPERHREYRKNYYETNRERLLLKLKEWREKNPKYFILYMRNKKKKQAVGSGDQEIRGTN